MADAKISALAELLTPATTDLLVVVDVSDTSMAASGTDKKIQVTNLLAGLETTVGSAAKVAAHEADTTAVHGIANTANLILEGDSRLTDSRAPSGAAGGVLSGTYPNPGFAVDMATQAELDAHASDTTSVHGIADTSALETTSGAQSKADAAAALAAILAPATSARNVIQPSAADAVALTLKGHATQTADLFKITNSADAALFQVQADGDVLIGGPTPNGAGLQYERSYTDPADTFTAFSVTTDFTGTVDTQPLWTAHSFKTVFTSETGGPIYELDGFASEVVLFGDNPIVGDNPLYYPYAGYYHTYTDASSSADWWDLFGFYGLAEHRGSGTINLVCGGVFSAKLQNGAGAVGDSLLGISIAVENLHDSESPDAYSIYVNAPILEGHSGGFTNYYGLYVVDPEIANVSNPHAIYTEGGKWFMGNSTAPSSDPTGGGYLYANAGALYWRGSSGTITKVADA